MHLAGRHEASGFEQRRPVFREPGRSRGARRQQTYEIAGPFVLAAHRERIAQAHDERARIGEQRPIGQRAQLARKRAGEGFDLERRGLEPAAAGVDAEIGVLLGEQRVLIGAERAERRHVLERPLPQRRHHEQRQQQVGRKLLAKHGGQEPRALLVRPPYERGDAARGRNRRCGIARALPRCAEQVHFLIGEQQVDGRELDAVAMTREGVARWHAGHHHLAIAVEQQIELVG